MKNTKKLLSIFLMLTLLLALGSQAFAAGTITVVDAGTYGYRAYKVFDAASSGADVNYTIAAGSLWLPVVYDKDNGASKIAGLSFTPDANPATVYTVKELPGFSAAQFAETLKNSIPTGAAYTGFTTNTTTNQATAEDPLNSGSPLASGYYLVVSSDQATFSPLQTRASLTTVLDTQVIIQNKNDMPFEKTVDDQKTKGVKIGDELTFKIESKVPTDVGLDDNFYGFLISDVMDKGLTFDKTTLNVKIDGTSVSLTETESEDAILTGDRVRFGKNGKTFELSLDMLTRGKPSMVDDDNDSSTPDVLQANPLAGKPVVITYKATVNSDAAAVVSENNAVLTYGNDPQNYTIKDSQTKVYDSRIVIDKFENGAPEQKLQNAQFKLIKYTTTDGGEGTGVDKETPGATAYYYKAQKDTSNTVTKVEWDTTEANGTVETTDVNGAASFIGLKDGVYYLKETQAPAGYTQLTDLIKITVDGSHSITPGMDKNQIAAILTNVANVANTPGTVLPSTGGIGTTIFYLVGSVLVFGAAIVLILRKRSEA